MPIFRLINNYLSHLVDHIFIALCNISYLLIGRASRVFNKVSETPCVKQTLYHICDNCLTLLTEHS